MGYYNYQNGLIYHHLSEAEGWHDHLKNCRAFIIKSLESVKPSVVTVLGSGWLLDLPLKEISEKVREINLVDIIHPPEVKKQVATMSNVFLREEDVTGGLIGEAWLKAGRRTVLNRLRSLDTINIPEYKPAYDPGMVISLNILTQLESMPLELLRKKSVCNENEFLRFRKKIQENHISFLKGHISLLITDLSEIITEKSGKVYEDISVVADLPAGKEREEWTWQFDSKSSDYYRKKSVFRVAAILF